MTFAFINEAWGTNDLKKKKKNTDSKPSDISYPKSVYNVYPNEPETDQNPPFVNYDDFYKSDFFYSSKVSENKPTPESIETSMVDENPHNIVEPFMNNRYDTSSTQSSNRTCNNIVDKDQMYMEFILFVICGVFLILILEQFLQIGSKCMSK